MSKNLTSLVKELCCSAIHTCASQGSITIQLLHCSSLTSAEHDLHNALCFALRAPILNSWALLCHEFNGLKNMPLAKEMMYCFMSTSITNNDANLTKSNIVMTRIVE
jgi:hypothetical protein